jgi:hypothetical protein
MRTLPTDEADYEWLPIRYLYQWRCFNLANYTNKVVCLLKCKAILLTDLNALVAGYAFLRGPNNGAISRESSGNRDYLCFTILFQCL